MFFGKYCRSLDDDHRVVLPASFRIESGGAPGPSELIICAGFRGQSLLIFSPDGFAQFGARIRRSAGANPNELQRQLMHLYSSAVVSSLDRRYRFVIPQTLRELAGITKKVVFIGMTSRISLWSAEEWERTEAARGSSPPAAPPILDG